MISAKDLKKVFKGPVVALRDFNLHIEGTGVFGLVGPNGAGKTTLMRIIATILQPTKGTINILGKDALNPSSRRIIKQAIGYLPQEPGIYHELTALEFLDYVSILKGVDQRSRIKQIPELIDTFGLSEAVNRKLKTYSRGMKQRLALAQAILGNPRILIVDEPTSGLDPEERVRIRNLLSEIAQKCLVILSTHIIDDVAQMCSRFAVMNYGQKIFEGTSEELINPVKEKVFSITLDDPKPPTNHVVVSKISLEGKFTYRVLATGKISTVAKPLEPSLEDAYLWLMRGVTTNDSP
jgi:ABC-type multidrug transport system ATPase subunit